jgi:hypothetical protein
MNEKIEGLKQIQMKMMMLSQAAQQAQTVQK